MGFEQRGVANDSEKRQFDVELAEAGYDDAAQRDRIWVRLNKHSNIPIKFLTVAVTQIAKLPNCII